MECRRHARVAAAAAHSNQLQRYVRKSCTWDNAFSLNRSSIMEVEAGVSVRGSWIAFDCEDINLGDLKLGESELMPFLQCFSQGLFSRVKRLNLVNAAIYLKFEYSHACGAEG